MATQLEIWNQALALLADHRLVATTDDVEARYALDNSWDEAIQFVFHAAFWRFAMKTESLAHNGALPTMPGYSSRFALPATFYRAHAVFVLSGSRECPVDVRQQGEVLHANVTPINLRYVDSTLIAPDAGNYDWPIPVQNAVAAYLAFLVSKRITQNPSEWQDMFSVWERYLVDAQRMEAVPVDPWLEHQFAGAFMPAVRFVLEQGFWRFALRSETITDSPGDTLPDYAYGADIPDDWLKTQALFVPSNGRECPFDVKEHDSRWSSEVDEFTARYLSTDGYDSTLWPDEFRAVVEAYLGNRNPVVDQEGRTSAPPWVELLQSAMINACIPASPWLQHQFSGAFDPARRFILEQGFWAFATKTATLTAASGATAPGYTNSFAKPVDWLKTQALFTLSDEKELPFDVRENGARYSADIASFYIRYLSSDGINATIWPNEFWEIVESYLAGREAVMDENGRAKMPPWAQLLERALSTIAIPESKWLDYQLDGSFITASRYMLHQGFWAFALKAVTPTSSIGTTLPGFTYGFDRPADWFRTQALFIASGNKELPFDIREHGTRWSSDTQVFVARYVSTDGLSPEIWPDEYLSLVEAHLVAKDPVTDEQGRVRAPAWVQMLDIALGHLTIPESPWLAHQLSGRFISVVEGALEETAWNFAIKTVELEANAATPSSGYEYAFDKPADFLRSLDVYDTNRRNGEGLDYRDEGGDLHAAYSPITLRYLSSTLGRDATTWSAKFEDAVLTEMQRRRAIETPGTPGAVIQSLSFAARDKMRDAKHADAGKERPRINPPHKFVNGRFGWGWGRSSREQGRW